MAQPVVKAGQEGTVVLVRRSRRRNPYGAVEAVIEYEGPHDAVAGIVAANYNNPDILEWSEDGPISTLVIRAASALDGAAETPVDVWDIQGNSLQNPWEQSPLLAGLLASDRAQIEAQIAAARAQSSGVYTPTFTASAGGATTAFLTTLYYHILGGYDSILSSQYVLRKSTAYSGRYTVNMSFSNVLRLFTTAQLKTAEPSILAPVLFTIDAVDASLPAPNFSTELSGYFVKSWLKQTPTLNQVGAARWQVTNEYWFGYFSTFLYPTAT